MKLEEYLYTNNVKLFEFADELGIHYKTLYLIMRGHDMKLTLAKKIQDLTQNQVTCDDLVSQLKQSKT